MAKRSRQQVQAAREEKRQERGRRVKESFVEAREEGRTQNQDTRPLVPRNDKQVAYIRSINENPLTVATGFAGTSKTYIPTVMACDAYLRGDIDKIVFTRPNVSNSKSLGMFKGSAIEKMEMWLMPVISILRDRLTNGGLESAIKNGNIVFMPLEVVKGYSAENCFFIIDEGEDITVEEAEKLMTRQGKNCKMVISGDLTQSELKERSGLKWISYMVNTYPSIQAGFIDFNHKDDIVRGEACKAWIIAIHKEKNKGGALNE